MRIVLGITGLGYVSPGPMSAKRETEAAVAEEPEKGGTPNEDPGEVVVDEPTKPALSGKEKDEFDEQAERQESGNS